MKFVLKKHHLNADIEKLMQTAINEKRIGNAAVSVWQNGAPVFRGFYGRVQLNDEQKPNEHSLFRLASMSKPVTAVAVLMQCENGLLDLDKPLSYYLPAFRNLYIGRKENEKIVPDKAATTPVTVRHLLTHTSGIGSGEFGLLHLQQMSADDSLTLESAVRYYAGLPLLFEPGTRSEYSPLFAFDILAFLVECTADRPYADFLKEKLFDPLGMHDATFAPDAEQRKRLVYMHDCKDGKNTDATPENGELFPGVANSRCCGGAGLASSLHDYEIFAQMLLQKGTYRGVKILSASSVERMASEQISSDVMPGNQCWGLGVRVIAEKSYRYLPVGAFGWSGAFGTHFWVDPSLGVTAVLLRNSLIDGGAGACMANQFEKNVYGKRLL